MSVRQSPAHSALAALLLIYLLALLILTFVGMRYHLDSEPAEPEESLPALPEFTPDFRQIEPIAVRKQTFFEFMRPFVAHQNAFYTQERQRLQALVEKLESGEELNRSDRRQLAEWQEMVNIPDELSLAEQIELLQRRLDAIPEAMVLAQAAAESAWGQSRFARDANNFFGQWCYTAGCGLVPHRRATNATHEVRHFDSALEAVQSYFRNINTHWAYRDLRDKRWALRQAGEEVTGYALVGELGSYSERGPLYIRELRQIIRGNELE